MIYLINFVLCSGLLLAVYKLFLQNERMYRFNRFYLLFSLVLSAAVPFIVVTGKTESIPLIYQQAVRETFSPVIAQASPQLSARTVTDQVEQVNYLPLILMGAYLLIASVLMLRFILNLIKISRKVTGGEHVIHQHNQMVLMDDNITPHSFLRYIFISRDDHENGSVEPEVICHEQAHVRQLHTLDVLLVELFQAVCWFNPFIPMYRKAIQLNHEFLADEAVTELYDDTPAYQYLLLARASQPGSLQLTSQFNYQTTKKRLIMMTKTTSASIAVGKKLMLIPVAAMAVLLFSEKTQAKVIPAVIAAVEKKVDAVVAAKPVADTPKRFVRFPIPNVMRVKYSPTDAPQSVLNEYDALLKKYDLPDGGGKPNDIPANDKAKMKALFVQMSAKQQDGQMVRFVKPLKPVAKNKVTDAQLAKWQSKDFGVWIDDKRVKNADLVNYKGEDFDHVWFSNLTPLARKNDGFKYQINLMTKDGYAKYYKDKMADQEDKIDVWHMMPKRAVSK